MDDENELLGPPDDPEIEKNRVLSIFGKILSNEPVQQLTAIDVQNVELAVSKKNSGNQQKCEKLQKNGWKNENPKKSGTKHDFLYFLRDSIKFKADNC